MLHQPLCRTSPRSRFTFVARKTPMSDLGHHPGTLSNLVEHHTGISISRCYQCGKCSAGCPAAHEMDYPPSLLLRHLQTGWSSSEEKVLGSYTIWLCLSCHTCAARCPMEVDLPTVMDFLRQESLQRNLVHPRARDIIAFHRSFLDTIRRFGRLWEVGLVADYKLRTRHFWQDVALVPGMLKRGKLSLLPHLAGRSARREGSR
jgi:heterodisulfide reductase subunit C2